MEAFAHQAEYLFSTLVRLGVLALELCGAAVVLITSVKALVSFFRKDSFVRLSLAEGIALGLEFKLGGEVLRTTIVRDWSELGILGAIILLRGALTLLLHWEIKHEEIRCGPIPIDRA
jgi:uncharacterized membrane protein